jgi:hypothetical protein
MAGFQGANRIKQAKTVMGKFNIKQEKMQIILKE